MIFGNHDENTLAQFHDVASRAVRSALMADGHFGYIMPVGGVTAYRNQVSIAGVGYDIGCGNTAIRTDLLLDDLVSCTRADIEANPVRALESRRVNRLADEIFSQLSFGIGRKNLADDAPVDHELFVDAAWWTIPNAGGYRDSLMDKGRKQLGTIGSGNHRSMGDNAVILQGDRDRAGTGNRRSRRAAAQSVVLDGARCRSRNEPYQGGR